MKLAVSNIGRTRYADAWTLQHKLFELRHHGLIGDLLLYTEHEHVYTIGKGGDDDHLLASEAELRQQGIDVFHIDRGGDITYHGPGQVVGYPIIDLNGYAPDIHRYLRALEDVLILALLDFGIEAGREEGLTGVWVKGEKIAAIGVKVSRWITMHGFALNVYTDLHQFDRIIPCGIFHKGVTSVQRILGKEIALEPVHDSLTRSFAKVFGCQPFSMAADDLRRSVRSLKIDPPSSKHPNVPESRQLV